MPTEIILASTSTIRQDLLKNAGVEFNAVAPRVDEEMIRDSLLANNASPRDIADQLAEAKARKVASKHPNAMVLACDQILQIGDTILNKPKTKDEAHAQLTRLVGQSHRLISAAVVYENLKPVWRTIGVVKLHMRTPSPEYLDSYIERNWDSIRFSVGGYKLEEEGARLFHKIEGDYFNVLGIPLLDVLAYFTLRGVIDG